MYVWRELLGARRRKESGDSGILGRGICGLQVGNGRGSIYLAEVSPARTV